MEKRVLGSSGLEVSVVGLGCNNFGGMIKSLDTEGARKVVFAAIDAGITLLDTSDSYGVNGGSETTLGEILGDRAPVKSHHHQGFGKLGEGLRKTAWAEDGTIEGLEDPSRRFALGVLWHPEAGEDFALFHALVKEAGEYREHQRTR